MLLQSLTFKFVTQVIPEFGLAICEGPLPGNQSASQNVQVIVLSGVTSNDHVLYNAIILQYLRLKTTNTRYKCTRV